MFDFEVLKLVHVACAVLSISGFFLRGIWMVSGSRWFHHKWVKRLPHFVDSLLLLSAIAMVFRLQVNPLSESWLLAKIIALLLYIFFGLMAFRFAEKKSHAFFAWFLALLTAAYIVQTALTKSPYLFFYG